MTMQRKSGKRNLLATKGCVGRTLAALLSTIEEHNKGAQMHLREDIAKLYAYASEIRDNTDYFEEFLNSAPLSQLKRPPKSPDQMLRAVMNLAYPPKLASARYRRIKASWDARVAPDEVEIDLTENGSSRRRVRLEFEPGSLKEWPLESFPKGTELNLMIIATVESAERLIGQIVYLESD